MKELEKAGTQDAKNLELDEEAKPIRKAENAAVPEPDEANKRKRKGTRKVG